MPRLIDADDLLMDNSWDFYDENGNRNGACIAVENAPTVDAEPVVRCKDCIYYGDHGDEKMACAMMILYPNKPTDYCSLGERKEDAKTN